MKRGLTPTQAAELIRAARTLPPASRDQFMSEVDRRLAGIRHRITDGDVNAAIISALGDTNITTTSHFMCDAAPKEPIMARHDDDDDESPFDCYGVLKDGHTVRVSLQMRDAAMTRDAMARRGFDDSQAKHGPGPVYCDRSAARAAYEEMRRELSDAWRTPAADDAADRRRTRKGVSRDPFGRETGSWEEEKEDAASDAAPTMDAAEGRRRKQVAYDAMVADLCNSWRNPSPLPVADAAPPLRRDAVPLGPTYDAAEGRRIKQEAYVRMCAEDREAWKGPGR